MPKRLNRFIILGDTHTCQEEREHWSETWSDINALKPDTVLMLGDLTADWMGEDKGLQLAMDVFKDCNAPWYSIIGNHDLQGTDFDNDQDNLRNVLGHLGRDTPYFSVDIGAFTIIGLSNTVHRENEVSTQELMTGDKQLAWFEAEVKKKSSRPIIVLSHAPILGSDLLNMPELHVVVGNCYMNQNNRPGDLMRIVKENPNILFWFSGHSHLGHIYKHSIAARLGCHFVHCGIVSRKQSRDGNNHTRILDIYDDHFEIRTLDHSIREIDDDLEYRENVSIESCLKYRHSIKGKRYVPRDLKDSSQKASPTAVNLKLMWISDLHISGSLYPTQKRIIDWCRHEASLNAIDGVVLGGDMVQNGSKEDLEAFLKYFSQNFPIYPIYILCGNHEGSVLRPEGYRNVVIIDEDTSLISRLPENIVFLCQPDSTRDDQHLESIEKVKGDHLIIFAHHPITQELAKKLRHRKITWICGHTHVGKINQVEKVKVVISGAIDPIKVRKSNPEILILGISDDDISIERRHIPSKRLYPARLDNALYGLSTPSPTGNTGESWLQIPFDQLGKTKLFTGKLSLRLEAMPVEEAIKLVSNPLENLKHICIQFQKVPEKIVFKNGELSIEGHTILQKYCVLADKCAEHDICLDFEQSENIDNEHEKSIVIGGMPWHIPILIDELRRQCRKSSIGFCFNTSTGFSVKVSAFHPTFQNWIYDLNNVIHSTIITQVEASPRKTMASLTTKKNPMINMIGLKAILGETKPGLLHFVYGSTESEAEEALLLYKKQF
jgi:predicted MPP superfamily phosphohydrolase